MLERTCGENLLHSIGTCGNKAKFFIDLEPVKGVRKNARRLYLCGKHAKNYRPEFVNDISSEYNRCDNPPGSE